MREREREREREKETTGIEISFRVSSIKAATSTHTRPPLAIPSLPVPFSPNCVSILPIVPLVYALV